MQQAENKTVHGDPGFTGKVWITAGILSLVLITLLLFKTLFSVLLLALAGVLMAVYFHGCSTLLNRWLKLPSKFSLPLSVLLNIILITGFFWIVGARLEQQTAQLSKTLPESIANAKAWLSQSQAGVKVLDYLSSSGDSGKTFVVAKTFFSSSFGILSDVYIILLLGLFFTASPAVYKNGIIKLLPPKAKQKARHCWKESTGF